MSCTQDDNIFVEEEEEDVEMYECNSCQMNFTSVMEHVRRFHNGQKVVIEMDEQAQQESEEAIPEEPAEEEVVDTEEAAQEEQSDEMYALECLEYWLDDDVPQVVKAETKIIKRPKTPPMKTKERKIKKKYWGAQIKKERPNTEETIDPSEYNDMLYKCEHCDTVFPHNKSLRLHMKMHKPIQNRTIEEAMQSDMRGVQDEDVEQKSTFYCDKCKKEYDETFMEIHMRMHSNAPNYHCGICNKKFDNEENFTMHTNAHQERTPYVKEIRKKDTPRPYACRFCQKCFVRPHEKVKHERIHTGEKPHACEICGKTFRVAYCLTLHMRTHTMVRPYVCSICGRRFKAQAVYNHHLKTHSDERNYQCPFCPKTFKTSVQLSGHKNSHTKPFSCTECNRPFASLYAVRTHMEMHRRQNNGLRYKCDICGATYARNSSVKDHIKDVHNVEPLAEEGELFSEIDQEDVKVLPRARAPKGRTVIEETITADRDDDEELVEEAQWIQ